VNEFFAAALDSGEIGVDAAALEQFGVCPDFGNPAGFENNDPVGMARGRNAMRHEHRRPSGAHLLQPREDVFFGFGIDTREAIIQKQYRRVADQATRQAGALLLSTGKGDTAFSDQRAQMIGKALDRILEVGRLGRIPDFVGIACRIVIGAVAAKLVGEKKRVLWDERNLTPDLCDWQQADVAPIEINSSWRRIEKSNDRTQQSGLTGTDAAQYGDHFT